MPPVRLPVPPSANALWRSVVRNGVRGVALAKGYKTWLDEAILLLRLGTPVVKTYPVTVRIWVAGGAGWGDRRDLDNAIKGLVDAARKAQRIKDDTTEYVTRIEAQFLAPDGAGEAYCLLELVEPR